MKSNTRARWGKTFLHESLLRTLEPVMASVLIFQNNQVTHKRIVFKIGKKKMRRAREEEYKILASLINMPTNKRKNQEKAKREREREV